MGHLTPSFSSIEILYTLYNKIAKITKENIAAIERDRVIISKEHCRLAQVCVLAECGLLDKDMLNTYANNGSYLSHDLYGHVCPNKGIDAIDVASGSLGHGIGVGIGYAWDNKKSHTYVVVGDGELQEGSCWEGIIFAGCHHMKNLTLIIDKNNVQIDDYTKNILDTSSNIAQQIREFGYDVIECNGHDVTALEKALNTPTEKTKCIIAHTIKGKELSEFIKDKGLIYTHAQIIDEKNYQIALEEIQKNG